MSPTKWWEMRMDDSPSDEVSQYELEAASFDEPVSTSASTLLRQKTMEKNKPGKGSTTHAQKQMFVNEKMQEDPFKPHLTGDELDFCQGSTEILNKGGTAILDLIEKNMCNTNYIDSPTMRKLENNLTLEKLEEQLEKMNHPALWKILKSTFKQDDNAGSDSGSSRSSRPPSPVASLGTSFDDLDIISDLENDVAYFRQRSNDSEQSVGSTAKYKTLLKAVKAETSAPLPLQAGFFHHDEAAANHARPLTPRNNSKQDKRGRSRGPKLDFKSKELKSKERRSKSRSRKDNKSDEIKEKIKIVVERREAAETAQKHDPSIPSTVSADTPECSHTDENMSTLTDERHLYPLYPDFEEGRKTSCVPPLFQKRLNALKKNKVNQSGSSASTARMSGGSAPLLRTGTETHSVHTEGPMNTYYIYDYESPSHAYVAYFRRGLTASECLRVYEHPTPGNFETMKSEVVVKIDAATVSTTDCMVRKGIWWGDSSPYPLNLPIVPGTAFTGRVENIDRSVSSRCGLKVGDRVVSLVRVGANSRHLCINSDRLVKVPADNKKENSVACLPEIYLAAFQCLHLGKKNNARYRKNSLSNKSILILGGATTMGIALIEVARAAGAETVYATGRDKEFGRIEKAGGLPLSRDPRHWLSILVKKMDIIVSLDSPYGKPQLKYEHVQTLNSNGKIIIIGAPDQADKSAFDLDSYDGSAAESSRKLHNYNVFEAWDADMKLAKRDLGHLMKLLKDGLLRPKIAERIPLSKVPKAHDYLDEKQVNGFVLCEPWITGQERLERAKSRPPRRQRCDLDGNEEEQPSDRMWK
jgi:NADPH:quinone reductase-like Zn-dependent oxidoreductase